ncbi:MAG TPA: hypothetical protein VF943_12235 [Burkholderiales bacterium]
MKYTIETDAEFLRVKVWDRAADVPPTEVCVAIYKESRRLGRNRILIELDQKAALSAASQHMMVTRLPEIGFTYEDRIALVHRQPEQQRANDFINVLAENRSIMVRNFPDTEHAMTWLRQA